MGMYADHHLVYAVLLNFSANDERLCQLLKKLVPKDVKLLHHGNDYYLEISKCDDEALMKTEYYKLNEDLWFTAIEYSDHIYRLDKCDIERYYDYKTREYRVQKPLTEYEHKKIVDDIPLTEIEQNDLSFLLNSELKEYIIDHCWYNRVIVHCSLGEPSAALYRSLQYLIEVDVKYDRSEINDFKKKLHTIDKLDLIRDRSTGKIYIVLCDIRGSRLSESKYFSENVLLWDIVNPHTGVRGGSRFIINDTDACSFTEQEKRNLASIIDSELKTYILSHSWYDLLG